jgi:hypothetical protein
MKTLKLSAVALALAGLVLAGCEQGGPGQTGSPGGGGSTGTTSGGGTTTPGGAPGGTGGAAPAQSPK